MTPMRKVVFFDYATDENKYVFFVDEVGNIEISLNLLTTIMEEAGCGRDDSQAPQGLF